MSLSGIMEADLAKGAGLRCKNTVAYYESDIDSVVNAHAIGGAAGASVTEWTSLDIEGNLVPFCSTLVAQVVQAAPATATIQFRICGLNQFGEEIEELSPVLDLAAKTNNWVYFSKVFSWVRSVEFKSTVLDSGADTVDIGQWFNWTRTTDVNNEHHGGRNLGFAVLSRLGRQSKGDAWDEGRPIRNVELIRQSETREDEIIIDATYTPTLPLNGSTVTIADKVYTFKTVLTPADGDVLIAATTQGCADNLRAAINGGDGAGVTYGANTVAHPSVRATGPGDTVGTMKFHWRTPGSHGNFMLPSTTVADGVMVVLQGGEDGPDVIEVTVESDINAGGNWVYNNVAAFRLVFGYAEEGWQGCSEKCHITAQSAVATWTTGEQALVRMTVITGDTRT